MNEVTVGSKDGVVGKLLVSVASISVDVVIIEMVI
jgi:hypothetical protein